MKNKFKIVAALALLSLAVCSAAQAQGWCHSHGHYELVRTFVSYPWPGHFELRYVWVDDPFYSYPFFPHHDYYCP